MSELLRDNTGKVIGSLKEDASFITLYSVDGRYLGQYDRRTNKTFDSNGRVVALCNALLSLVGKV
jgi:hypothetical protein